MLAATLGPDVSLAMIVVDNATGEIRAHVGSPDYFDVRRAGQVERVKFGARGVDIAVLWTHAAIG